MCYHLKVGSSVTNGARINIRKPPKWGAMGTPPLGWGHGCRLKIQASSIYVTKSNLVVLRKRQYAEIKGNLKLGERWGEGDALRWGRGRPLEIHLSPRVILPNLVVLVQTVRALLDPLEKFDSSRRGFQGYSRSSEPTRIDPPCMTSY